MTERIYLSPPDVTQVEEDAIVRAFRSGWIAPLGPDVDAFETELAHRCGRQHAVALSSGTAALHLALLELGVKAGDTVMVASMTFIATASAITYVGAIPCFVDSDEAGLMDPQLLEEAIRDQRAKGARIAAIVPVDLLGKIADYKAINEVATRYGIPVLSDAAESLGASRNGKSAGSFGKLAAVSFNGNKIMTTSGGGVLLTDDSDVAQHVRYLATQARQPVVHYEHTDIGFNYRMSNLLAALGRAQLSRLDTMIEKRRQLRVAYGELFADVPGVTIFGKPDGAVGGDSIDNFWLTSILVDADVAGWAAADLMGALAEVNIESRPLWKPLHLQPVFAANPMYVNGISERLFNTGLSLPSGSRLSEDERARIFSCIEKFIAERA